jgi:hypothetical protein
VQNSDSAPSLNDNNESASRDDLSHKNDILQKGLERIGCPFQMGTWRIQVNNNTLKNVCSFSNAILHLSFRSGEWRTR